MKGSRGSKGPGTASRQRWQLWHQDLRGRSIHIFPLQVIQILHNLREEVGHHIDPDRYQFYFSLFVSALAASFIPGKTMKIPPFYCLDHFFITNLLLEIAQPLKRQQTTKYIWEIQLPLLHSLATKQSLSCDADLISWLCLPHFADKRPCLGAQTS